MNYNLAGLLSNFYLDWNEQFHQFNPFIMLTDSLKVAHHILKEELNKEDQNTSVKYPDEVVLEVHEIMQRLETLQFKLDCPLWSNGYKYEDGVTWKA